MKFFLPHTNDDQQAEIVYQGIKRYASRATGLAIADQKIFKIAFAHREREYQAEVGRVEEVSGEIIVAILESDMFMICTANRGIVRGRPIMVEKGKVHTIEYFGEREITTLCFENLSSFHDIRHFISTRSGGASCSPFNSLNLGLHVGDENQAVLENRSRLFSALEIPLDCLTAARQVHGSTVTRVSQSMRGRGSSDYAEALEATDAMITDEAGICLMIVVADCVPIIVYAPSRRVVGIAHAGWRGTVAGIALNLVAAFKENYSCSPDDLVVGIGPSIGQCCYGVGEDVLQGLNSVLGSRSGQVAQTSAGGTRVDLREANRLLLIGTGVREDRIELFDICTCCRSDQFFSVRHQQGNTGRFGAGVMLKK